MALVEYGTNEKFSVQYGPYDLHADWGREAIFLTKVFERWQNLFGVVLCRDDAGGRKEVEILKKNAMSLQVKGHSKREAQRKKMKRGIPHRTAQPRTSKVHPW